MPTVNNIATINTLNVTDTLGLTDVKLTKGTISTSPTNNTDITNKKYVDDTAAAAVLDPTQPLTLSGSPTSLTVSNNSIFNGSVSLVSGGTTITPTNNTDISNKKYVDDSISNKTTFNSAITLSAGGTTITPTNNTDIANKKYVDDSAASATFDPSQTLTLSNTSLSLKTLGYSDFKNINVLDTSITSPQNHLKLEPLKFGFVDTISNYKFQFTNIYDSINDEYNAKIYVDSSSFQLYYDLLPVITINKVNNNNTLTIGSNQITIDASSGDVSGQSLTLANSFTNNGTSTFNGNNTFYSDININYDSNNSNHTLYLNCKKNNNTTKQLRIDCFKNPDTSFTIATGDSKGIEMFYDATGSSSSYIDANNSNVGISIKSTGNSLKGSTTFNDEIILDNRKAFKIMDGNNVGIQMETFSNKAAAIKGRNDKALSIFTTDDINSNSIANTTNAGFFLYKDSNDNTPKIEIYGELEWYYPNQARINTKIDLVDGGTTTDPQYATDIVNKAYVDQLFYQLYYNNPNLVQPT